MSDTIGGLVRISWRVVRFGLDFDQVLVTRLEIQPNIVTKIDRLDAYYFLSFMKHKQVAL